MKRVIGSVLGADLNDILTFELRGGAKRGKAALSDRLPPRLGAEGKAKKQKVYLERAAAPVQGNEQKGENTHTYKRGTVKKPTNEQKKRNRDEKAHRKNR